MTTSSSIPTVKLLIDGEFIESTTQDWRDVVNPATQEVLARVPFATAEEIDRAVASGRIVSVRGAHAAPSEGVCHKGWHLLVRGGHRRCTRRRRYHPTHAASCRTGAWMIRRRTRQLPRTLRRPGGAVPSPLTRRTPDKPAGTPPASPCPARC